METIKISRDFSEFPGGRYQEEGDYSGEAFREEVLFPKYEKCEQENDKLSIDFDDTYGFATSFLEEAFGGLVRNHHKRGILNRIIIISKDDVTIPDLVRKYVTEAERNLA